MICNKCGHSNSDEAKFCYKCGNPLDSSKVAAGGATGFSGHGDEVHGTGQKIGPYEILGELGRGAMARVWRAWDPNLRREVAIKEPLFDPRLSPEVLEEMGRRFVSEGVTAAGLNHPNIVGIYMADVFDGRPAIVMELVEGATLGELLKGGALAPPAALDALNQLLDGVGYAHSKGVVHRDIKPDNVFVSADGRVKLADFGIARAESAAATHATMAGAVLGTPGYMSPEQAVGGQVDARSDLFSIGVVAYEMFSGRNPFGGLEESDATTLLYRIVHEPAPELRVQSGELPASVQGAIMASLAKDPADRPQSAEEFKAMLSGNAAVPVGTSAALSSAVSSSSSRSGVPRWLPYVLVAVVGVAVIAFVLSSALSAGAGGAAGAASTAGTAGAASTAGAATASGSAAQQVSETAGEAQETSQSEAEKAKAEAEKAKAEAEKAKAEAEAAKAEAAKPKGQYPPSFGDASASSVQSAEGYASASYSPFNTLDGNFATAWIEAGSGPGIGEWVMIQSSTPQLVSGVRIVNGFPKTEEIYYANYRPSEVTIELSDGYSLSYTLSDLYSEWQTINFDGQHATTYIKITINDAYNTNRWTDTAIAEIEAF